MSKLVYDFSVKQMDGSTKNMADYRGNALLIVNTASRCGFTPQLAELQQLHEKYSGKGFSVLGFPCNQFADQEPGSDEEIKSFCTLNYGVTFPLFSKIDVNGVNEHPLYTFLKSQAPGFLSGKIKWNFTKFLTDKNGNVVKRFSPSKRPGQLEKYIEKVL